MAMAKKKSHSFRRRAINVSGYVLLAMFALSIIGQATGNMGAYVEWGLYILTIAVFTHLIAQELK